MCSVDMYDKYNESMLDDASSCRGKLIPSTSYKEALLLLGHTINFIEN